MFETQQSPEGSTAAGDAGSAPVAGSTSAPPSPPPPGSGDAAKAKRDAAAKRARDARAAKKLERDERQRKKLEKLKAASNAAPGASSEPAQATEPKQPEGWPSEAAMAQQLPAAVMLLTQCKMALGSTRYGLALETQTHQVPDPKTGELKRVTVDPIAHTLAPPLAAMLAGGGGNMTPGQAFVTGCAFIFVPVAFFHGVEAALAWNERRKERIEREREAQMFVAKVPQPSPVDQPATPRPNGVALRLTDDTKGAPKA